MTFNENVLKSDEKAVFELRSLYSKYGYAQFKMSKFEEYDLYVKNKDFLISDSVITFTDTDGKLLALKPDVTLSIIKNYIPESGQVTKLYYNENIYRVSKGTHSYKEIMQTGLECIGDIDIYNICEVLMLAGESLNTICENWCLDISHMGVISSVIDEFSVPGDIRSEIIRCVGEKNVHEIKAICAENGISDKFAEKISSLVTLGGTSKEVVSRLKEICDCPAVEELEEIFGALDSAGYADKINIDFSITNNMNYYSGVVFQGFVEGVPTGILSGGQYDNLMKKMGKNCSAIGFAVYLDLIERLSVKKSRHSVDAIILYGDKTPCKDILAATKTLAEHGKSVIAAKSVPQDTGYESLIDLTEKEDKKQ
ncbi:MAG: ATP phosphoribosyltransferase regulatory subunit [Oscillospiraceae bacterium]